MVGVSSVRLFEELCREGKVRKVPVRQSQGIVGRKRREEVGGKEGKDRLAGGGKSPEKISQPVKVPRRRRKSYLEESATSVHYSLSNDTFILKNPIRKENLPTETVTHNL